MPLSAISPEQPRAAGKRPNRVRFRTRKSRLWAIRPLLKFQATRAEGEQPVFLISGDHISSLAGLASYRAAQLRISERTLWRWYKRFNQSGLIGLRREPRSDKGVSRIFQGRSLAVAFIYDRHEKGLTARAVFEALMQRWNFLYPGSRPPSCSLVRDFLKRFPKVRP
jgi:Homeodomain-like domain